MAEKPTSYGEAVKFEHAERGAYEKLDYEPTFAASAIFLVDCSDIVDTRISFMNYWREKNRNPDVSALLTLRDSEGKRVRREYLPLSDFTYEWSIRKWGRVGLPFQGSVEVQLHSTQDLKYAFPAVEVFYVTPGGVSCVHSNQRVFNNLEDMNRGSKLNGWQTGFDIQATDELSGYVSVINGPQTVRDSFVEFKIFNSEGRVREAELPLGQLPAYATRFLKLTERIPGLKEFLGARVGFCKVNVSNYGIFNRLACGNVSPDRSVFTVTHSYYDCNQDNDYFSEADSPSDQYACFLPLNLVNGLDLDVVFYPIYARSTLSFSIDCFDPSGPLIGTVPRIADHESTGSKMSRLDIREILTKVGMEAKEDRLYCLSVHSRDGKIPSRLTFGLNYHRPGEIGTNINSSVLMNQSYGLRKRLYLWAPLIFRGEGKNLILLSHFSKVKGDRSSAEVALKLFSQNGLLGEKSYRTVNATAHNIDPVELLSESRYAPKADEILWYTLESSCPNYISNQIHGVGQGYVGGDHSF